jgi:hypothetical protein
MDDKELNKYKPATIERDVNNLRKCKLTRYRKNKKPSIDVVHSIERTTAEERKAHFEKVGVKNSNGSFTIGGNEQMINHYESVLYSMLEKAGLPTDNTVKYKSDGTVIPFDSNNPYEWNYELIGYLISDRFNRIPNVTRIAKLLSSFKYIRLKLAEGKHEMACNSLLHAIHEYTSIRIINLESNFKHYSTTEASKEKTKSKENNTAESIKLAKEFLAKNPRLSKLALAKKISKEKGWGVETIRQEYLKGLKKI